MQAKYVLLYTTDLIRSCLVVPVEEPLFALIFFRFLTVDLAAASALRTAEKISSAFFRKFFKQYLLVHMHNSSSACDHLDDSYLAV